MTEETYLDELLDRWEEAREEGKEISPEELCRDHPELLDPLREQIAALVEAEQRLATRISDDTQDYPALHPEADSPLYITTEFGNLRYHNGGGLGVVFRATDMRMHRDVAVKFLRRRYTQEPEPRSRFLIEAEVTARLDHPGIIAVHGLGETPTGRQFYVMRFIEGRQLSEAIEEYHAQAPGKAKTERRMEFRDLLSRFTSACRTIAYAHNRGIVHRDIKPANIILGRYGETLVADWGLALPVGRDERFRVNTEHTLVPRSGDGKSSASGGGTPAYMSPEQHADTADIKPATDIYSLGATLFKLLTGKTAIGKNNSYHDIRTKVMMGRLPAPREVNPEVPPALEAVCLKAMAVLPEERYATALDLAEDIEKYLADEPVSAYQEPASERMMRWVRRHKGGAQIGMASLLVVLLVTVGASLWLARMARRETVARQKAESMTGEVARTNARLVARTMANDINIRLLVLQEDSRDPHLRQLLADYNAAPENSPRRKELQKDIQNWLYERAQEREPLAGRKKRWAGNWFVYDRIGTQVARVPYKDGGQVASSIGRNFAYRSYFSGKDRDLPPGAQASPHQHVAHISAVYRSVVDGRYKVGFTVPVHSPANAPGPHTVIGILGVTVDLGEITAVDIPHVTLIDLRTDYLENGQPRRGLILHHARLQQVLRGRKKGGKGTLPRIEAGLLERMQQVRAARAADDDGPGNLLQNFIDRLEGDESGRPAAFEPVIVDGNWPAPVRNTGWIILVQVRGEKE